MMNAGKPGFRITVAAALPAEHDYTNACMRQKDYELVPEPPASARN